MNAADEVEAAMHSEITELVESYWQAFLTIGPKSSPKAVELIATFDSRVQRIGDGLGGAHGEAFVAAVQRERNRLLHEYETDPTALRRRLGIPSIEPTSHVQQAESVGEMVARTAIRATVWETVRALFADVPGSGVRSSLLIRGF